MFINKLIDFKAVRWPVKDPIKMKHHDAYYVRNYMFPPNPECIKNKRILFFHGYGDYSGRYAYFMKYFAD